MQNLSRKRPTWAAVTALVALAFGALTVFSGGRVLFGPEAARAAAGNYVPFVLWFNFLAGFAYVVAGAGVLPLQPSAGRPVLRIPGATALVFAAARGAAGRCSVAAACSTGGAAASRPGMSFGISAAPVPAAGGQSGGRGVGLRALARVFTDQRGGGRRVAKAGAE